MRDTGDEDFVPFEDIIMPDMFFGILSFNSFSVEIINDDIPEDDETFLITAMPQSSVRESDFMETTVTILDSDIPSGYCILLCLAIKLHNSLEH